MKRVAMTIAVMIALSGSAFAAGLKDRMGIVDAYIKALQKRLPDIMVSTTN